MKQVFSFLSILAVASISCKENNDCCAQTPNPTELKVSIGLVGDAADVQTITTGGTVLMGGSTDVDEAIKWMIRKSGGGDFIVIRATGSTGYSEYIKGLGQLNSVETLLIDSRDKANLETTKNAIMNAEALFIAGGDQKNYVDFWKDTETAKAIQYLIDVKKAPIGGTSAGCAILSGYIFDAKNGTAVSGAALANPFDSQVSVIKSFIQLPFLENVIADQHYSQRDRQGRHVVFMARMLKDFGVSLAKGIGVDEKTAVAIDEKGQSFIFGSGNAYFLFADQLPEQCESQKKLNWDNNGKAIRCFVWAGTNSGTEGLNLSANPAGQPNQYWTIVDGVFKSR
ncbi:MAG: cyanophycinase [Cytophagales bacterium]